jgi:hypothetical protein
LARENTIVFYKPTLPEFINEMTITNLRINDSVLMLQARKVGTKVNIEILSQTGPEVNFKVVQEFPVPTIPEVHVPDYSS